MLSLKAKPRHEPAPPFHILGALAQARGHHMETGSLTLTPAQSPRTAEFASAPVPRLPTVAAALASVPRKLGPMRLSLVPDSSATYCPQGSLRVDSAGSRSAQGLCLGHFPNYSFRLKRCMGKGDICLPYSSKQALGTHKSRDVISESPQSML